MTTPGPTFPTADAAIAELERRHGPAVHTWTYANAAGEPLGVILRWDTPDGKNVRPASYNGSGWTLRGMPSPRPLYALPEVLALSMVFVCEGEKAADAVRACGLIATTSAHGSKSAAKSDWSALAGREVVILPDYDAARRQYAENVATLAAKAGARSVRIAPLIDTWPGLPPGGDAADVLELEGGDADALRAKLETLAANAEPITGIDDTPAGPPRFEPFPADAIPEPIRSYITEGARAIGCDACYLALPVLAGLASAIGNTRRLAIKRSWSEPPILWCAIVGESGTAKSPAMELALRPVRSRQHRAMKEHSEAVKAWDADYARWEVEQANWK
ncbi:MAG: DUF3987 domain-containing protein, partial [Planctomycetota bacterium]